MPRLNGDELSRIAETMSRKLNNSAGEVRFLIPLRGFSSIDCEGNDFYDPVGDEAFIDSLKKTLNENITIKEIDAHINDSEFSEAVVNEFLDII